MTTAASSTELEPRPRAGTAGAPGGSALGWVAPTLLAAGFLGLFFRWLWTQHRHSSNALEDWGHAYIVPVIAGYAIWLSRDRLAKLPRCVFAPGLAPVLLGIAGYFAAVIFIRNHMIQGAFVLMTLGGLVLTLFGPRVLRAVFLPLAFLVFAITVSERVMLAVTFRLQTLAAEGSHIMLSIIGAVFGFGSEVRGNTLTIIASNGDMIPLNVAEACSGMRMVVAFIALAGSVALLNGGAWWKRIALMLTAVPIAVFMNVVRVAVLGIATLFDPELAAGEAHTLIGTILLLPALGLFMLIIWALDRVIKEDKPAAASTQTKAVRNRGPRFGTRPFRSPVFIAAIVALVGSASTLSLAIEAYGFHLSKKPIYPPGDLGVASIPAETGEWRRVGSDRLESAAVLEELGTDNYLTRIYEEKVPEGEPRRIEVHLAYYTGMVDTVPHVPERCFVGGGLSIGSGSRTLDVPIETDRLALDTRATEELGEPVYTARLPNRWSDRPGARVRLPGNPEQLRMRITEFLDSEGRAFYSGYFFVANGGTVASAEDVRLLAFDLTDDYAYYLKVQFRSLGAESPEELARDAAAWLDSFYGELARCVPDWYEVRLGLYPESGPDESGES